MWPTAVACTIESNGFSDTIVSGLTLTLGTKGRAAYEREAARIIEDGGLPPLVALIERAEPTATILVTPIALPVLAATTVH